MYWRISDSVQRPLSAASEIFDMQLPTLADFELNGKTVLVRQDLNVPIQNGQISSDARIRAALPTLRQILAKGGRLRIMSHLGRPEEGIPVQNQPEVSLAPVAAALEAALGEKVTLVDDYLSGVFGGGDAIVLFENVRVNAGEKRMTRPWQGSLQHFAIFS